VGRPVLALPGVALGRTRLAGARFPRPAGASRTAVEYVSAAGSGELAAKRNYDGMGREVSYMATSSSRRSSSARQVPLPGPAGLREVSREITYDAEPSCSRGAWVGMITDTRTGFTDGARSRRRGRHRRKT
jgi:hypothetical protein